MEFSKLKSKYQRSFRSIFSLTKEWIFVSKKKQILSYNLNNLFQYLEYFLFNCKLFCFSIKKNYLFELITFKKINNFFVQNYLFLFFKKLKNSRSTILLFFNIPFLFSLIISEIFESIIKKTIYLYRFFLLLSIPVLLFCVNRNLVLQNKKDYLSFLLPENKKIFLSRSIDGVRREEHQDEKKSFYLKILRKRFFHNYISKFLSNKIKHFNIQKQNSSYFVQDKLSYLSCCEPNFSNPCAPLKILSKVPLIEGAQLVNNKKLSVFNQIKSTISDADGPYGRKTKSINQQSIFLFKWLDRYLIFKKFYLNKFSNNYSTKDKKLNFNSHLNSLDFCQFSKKNSFLKQKFLQNFDNFFLLLIKPRDLNYLSNIPLHILSKRYSAILDLLEIQNEQSNKKSFSIEEKIHGYQPKQIKKNEDIIQSSNKQQWMLTIRQWMKFYPSQNKFSWILKNKQNLKENFQLFSLRDPKVRSSFQFIIQFLKNFFFFWTPVEQFYFEKSLLNREPLRPIRDPEDASSFISNRHSSVFRSYKNSLNFPSYLPLGTIGATTPVDLKDAVPLGGSIGLKPEACSGFFTGAKWENLENFIFILKNKYYYLEYFPFSSKETINKQIFQKINFLYNFSFHFNNDYLFINPEALFLMQTTKSFAPLKVFFFQRLRESPKGALANCKNFLIDNQSFYADGPSSREHRRNGKETFFSSSIQTSKFISFQKDFKVIKKKREKLQNIINSTKIKFFKKYNTWIFTPQWWLFRKHEIFIEIQSLLENFTNTIQVFLYWIFRQFSYSNKKYLSYVPSGIQRTPKIFLKIPNNFMFAFDPKGQIQNWNKLFVESIYTSHQESSFWINLKLLSPVNNRSWSFFAWFITSSIVYYHWLPMLTGVIYLYLWLDFEKIRSLSNPSWKTFLNILTHNSFDSPSQQLRLAGYLSKGRLFFIYSKLYKFSNKIFFIFNRFNSITTLDLSRRNKNLVSNSLITKKTLQSKYYFWNTNKQTVNGFVEKNKSFNGFNFFQKWYEKNSRISNFFQKNEVKSFSLNWLNNLFFYNKFLILGASAKSNPVFQTSRDHLRNGKMKITCQSKPTLLSEPIPYTQRWLFIGSLESGKSFVIKNIAASTHYPLIHISIKDIKNATPDSKYNKIRKQKRWIEQLSERSFFLENIFHLAKIVSPSIFWISDLHDFETKNQIQEKNTQKFDISLLMATLLKILSIDLVPEKQNHITFIGSTEYPRLLDPKFVSRQRLDLIVNFRTPSFQQRQHIFSFLLKTKGFTIKGLRSFYELNSNTLGYTFRDITSLVNETLLIKTTENNTLIDSNTIRLALYRQTSTQSVKYKIIKEENIQYKIGKALVQAILVYPKSIILLSKYHDLWKTKFYYLSNTYLEVSSKKAITTEFVLLTQILNCLAGSAARDAWILSTKRSFNDHYGSSSLALTSQLKHDFSIASNILQSLLVEFSMQDIISLSPKKKKNREDILKTFHFHFLKKAASLLEFFDPSGPSYINWSIKGKRLSFNWILLFSGIEHSTKKLTRLLLLDKNKKNIFSSNLEKGIDINIPYDRRETKRQQQKLQKIDSLFNKMVYTMYMENLGFPWESEYVMGFAPFQFSLFFREARPLWNPQTIMPSYSILFFDRDLLINQKLLTKLYITYGNKFQIEKLNRKRIKKQSFWSSFAFNKADLEKISERKKDLGNYQIASPHGFHWSDFHFYQNLINLNAQLDQSQIQLPVYLHQGWITADPNETFGTFDISSTKVLVNNDHLIYKEAFLFEILLEIYHYLLKFFIQNRNIMIHLNDLLIKNKILYRQDIETIMKKYYNYKF